MNELEMAKKRERKILITDEAIKKVPYIEYKGIPEKENAVIRELAQLVLKISREQNNSNEVAITYSLESEKLIESGKEYVGFALGTEHGVDPMEDTVSYHLISSTAECVIVSLHNHPSLSKISLADVRFFIFYSSIKMLAIVTNLGSISYMVKGQKFDFSIASQLLREAIALHNNAKSLKGYQEAALYFISNCYKAGIIYDDK